MKQERRENLDPKIAGLREGIRGLLERTEQLRLSLSAAERVGGKLSEEVLEGIHDTFLGDLNVIERRLSEVTGVKRVRTRIGDPLGQLEGISVEDVRKIAHGGTDADLGSSEGAVAKPSEPGGFRMFDLDHLGGR